MMEKRISRRQFLKLVAGFSGVAGLTSLLIGKNMLSDSIARAMGTDVYIPFLMNDRAVPTATAPVWTDTPVPSDIPTTETPVQSPTPTKVITPGATEGKVIHAHANQATSWNQSSPQYWNYVNQDVVNQMVDQGLMALTGQATVQAAWRQLLPNYTATQKIAIKVSFNNSNGCSDVDGAIDAIIHPVNAMVRGLKLIGVPEANIWVFDAIRPIPSRFANGCLYPGVRFFDRDCHEPAGWNSTHPSALVSYTTPAPVAPPPPSRIADVLVNADYLINLPIMKWHPVNGISVVFKNHFGTIQSPGELHSYVEIGKPNYTNNYSCLVQLYQSPHIVGKTILTVCDALFAATYYTIAPTPWVSFGNRFPNSLFFATDPVALESVMCDFIHAEVPIMSNTDDYLKLAQAQGLGIYERGNPWGSGYERIQYHRIEI